ncbi:MAG: protein kinase [Myxococcota bacterium]
MGPNFDAVFGALLTGFREPYFSHHGVIGDGVIGDGAIEVPPGHSMKKVCPVCKTEYDGGEVFCPVDAARLVSPSQMHAEPDKDDPLLGATFDKYKVRRRIGEGGMGLVYEAEHTVIEKRVAMKVLRDDFSSREEVVERFRQEAKSASRIGHENIVDISDFGTTPQGQSYFVMEFLEGEDLANVLARETVLPAERTAAIVLQCCAALGAAHEKGIVHRDMKPENVFLVERGSQRDFVKIVDFGIAKMSDIETEGAPGRKLTKTGMIFGTPEYMSPEQAAGKSLDHRVDVYAVGVILFECLVGRVPFVGDSFMGILTQHMFEEPPALRDVNPNVSCSAELEMVVYKALSKDPDQRYRSMAELGEAVREAMQGRVSQATLVGYGEPVKAKARGPRTPQTLPTDEFPAAPPRRGGLIAMLAVLLIAVGAGAVWFAMRGNGQTPPVVETPPDPPQVGSQPTVEPDPEQQADPDPVEVPPTPMDAPTTVAVRIETRPGDGATVTVDGATEGCTPTPCSIEAAIGEEIIIHAQRDRSRGQITLTPTTETTVQVVLIPRRTRGMRMRADPMNGMTGMTGMTGMRGDDLKMPTIFQ